MMESKPITDVIKNAATVSDISNKSVLTKDSKGVLTAVSMSQFARIVYVDINSGDVIKIRGLQSFFASARARVAYRYAFIWCSTYGNGQQIRSTCVKFANNGYAWYVNGPSDTNACIYLVGPKEANSDVLCVVSLCDEMPSIEKVASLPNDATEMQFV